MNTLATLAVAGWASIPAMTPPPAPGIIEFTGVRVRVTVPDLPGIFEPTEINIRQKRFNELRADAGLPPCQRAGMTLDVLSGASDGACGVPSFMKLRLEVIDDDFGGDWDAFCPSEAILFGLVGTCPPIE